MNNGMNEETDGYLHYHLKSVSCSHKVTNTNGDSCVCEHFTQVEFVSVMFIHSAAISRFTDQMKNLLSKSQGQNLKFLATLLHDLDHQ